MNGNLLRALSVFPEVLKKPVEKAAEISPDVQEIRLIADSSLFFYTSSGIRFVTKGGGVSILPNSEMLIPTFAQLENISDRAIGFSGFSHEKELEQGYITYGGACRMGICTGAGGDGLGHGKITSLVIRIPFEGSCEYTENLDSEIKRIKNGLLIAGAPASGKTTLLRYIARKLSDGITGELRKVTVIDERRELSGGYFLGSCTDVLSGKNKASAILHAVRTLSPHYIICDEIGSSEEAEALLDGLNSGIKFIASIHAEDMESLKRRRQFQLLYDERVFDSIVFLSSSSPGKIEKIYTGGGINLEIHRDNGIVPVA